MDPSKLQSSKRSVLHNTRKAFLIPPPPDPVLRKPTTHENLPELVSGSPAMRLASLRKEIRESRERRSELRAVVEDLEKVTAKIGKKFEDTFAQAFILSSLLEKEGKARNPPLILSDTDDSDLDFDLLDEDDWLESDEYVFYSTDSSGNKLEEKKMRSKGGTPFRIELSHKGFEPEDIMIDSTQNRVIISMMKSKPSKGSGFNPRPVPKVYGIMCPTVEAVDHLRIHYPKDGILLIEGPASRGPQRHS